LKSKPSAVFMLLLFWGVISTVAGLWLYKWAHPSPHGYIEVFLAAPLLALGGLLCSIALLVERRRFGWPVQALGWTLFAGSLVVIISIIALLARGML
jgi:hypothetical protein